MSESDAVDTSDPLVWVGFSSGVLSAFGSCAALMIIRLSTEKEGHLPFCQRKLFFIGSWTNMVFEVGLTSVALALCPLSLLSPISGLTIVFGACFAWVGLFGIKRERPTAIEACGLLITCAGVAVAAVFGPSSDGQPDLYATSWRLLSWAHIVYFFIGTTISLGWTALHTFDRRLGKYRPDPHHPICAPLSGTASAFLASYSLSMFKIIMTALRRLIGGDDAVIRYPFVWISAVFLFPCAALQIYTLNTTMGAGGTNYVLPCYTVMSIVLTASVGGLIFGEFEMMTASETVIFWTGGVLVTLFGLAILAVFQARRAALMQRSANRISPSVDDRSSTTDSIEEGYEVGYNARNDVTNEKQHLEKEMERLDLIDPTCFFCGLRMGCLGQAWW